MDGFDAHNGDIRDAMTVAIEVVDDREAFLIFFDVRFGVGEASVESGGSFSYVLEMTFATSY